MSVRPFFAITTVCSASSAVIGIYYVEGQVTHGNVKVHMERENIT